MEKYILTILLKLIKISQTYSTCILRFWENLLAKIIFECMEQPFIFSGIMRNEFLNERYNQCLLWKIFNKRILLQNAANFIFQGQYYLLYEIWGYNEVYFYFYLQ